ncbi:recombinase family protein [Microbacterium gilvum]|uniref:recombinase family protein n=1 Tax=Microbacterium gilvum TaxID=1336204 RepID=UPI003CD06E22
MRYKASQSSSLLKRITRFNHPHTAPLPLCRSRRYRPSRTSASRLLVKQTRVASVVAEFVDRGHSGRSIDLPELQRRLTYTREPSPDDVIVHKLDRLARSRADDIAITQAVQPTGAVSYQAPRASIRLRTARSCTGPWRRSRTSTRASSHKKS